MVLRLPEPMLARAGAIPNGRGWTFEPKLDGFRAMVCTHDGFRARSRRGWDMTPLLPELAAALPADVQLDGELVALDETGRPDFHRLSSRMLHGRPGLAVTYFVFDVLAVEGLATTMQPYSERGRCSSSSSWRRSACASSQRRGRGGAVRGGVRARPRGRRRQAGARPIRARGAGVGEDQEQSDSAFRGGAQRSAPVSAGEVRGAPAVHLVLGVRRTRLRRGDVLEPQRGRARPRHHPSCSV